MIRVGIAGWSYADWKGRVYPRTSSPDFHPLDSLARFFDCIEINSSFYALPNPRHVRDWTRRVQERKHFRFTVKLHRDLTHGRFDAQLIRQTLTTFEAMHSGDRFGAYLAQFHQEFADDVANRARLVRIAQGLTGWPLVVELRHRSWFRASTLAFLEDEGINLAHIDMPHPPSDAAPNTTNVVPQIQAGQSLPYFLGPLGYLRLHGRNGSNWFDPQKSRDDKYDWMYTREDSALFADYARRLAETGGSTYVVTNNHFAGKAVANALEVLSELNGGPVPGPSELVATYPALKDIVIPSGQGTLF